MNMKKDTDKKRLMAEVTRLNARVRELEERLKETEALRESARKYRILFDNADMLVSVYDRDGLCQLMNQRAADRFGGRSHAFIGKHLRELHPESGEEYTRRIQEVIDTGESREYEDKVAFPTGTRWLLSRVQPVPDIHGLFHSAQVISQDITDRKLAEAALRESEERYRRIFENSVVGFFQSTPQGRFIRVNSAFARIFGYDSPEQMVAAITDIATQYYVNPSDRHRYQQLLREKGYVENMEFQAWRRDGSAIWVSNSTRAYFGDARSVQYYEGIVIDISERKQAETALQLSKERIKAFFDHSPAGLIIFDHKLRYLSVNKTLAELNGLPVEAHIGKRLDQIFPEMARDLEEPLKRILDTGKPLLNVERRDTNHQGEVYDWLANMFPIPGYDGAVNAIGCVVLDVTERKRAEKDRVRLEDQIRQVQKLESVGRLAGGVAHDLNNLLSPIIGYSEMLLMKCIGEQPEKKSLEQILKAGSRARDLVRQLLAFSRKQALDFKPIHLNTLLKNFQSLLYRTIREDIAIHLELAASLPLIQGDIGQLEQVIMNLAVNAADAMPDGGTLTIESGVAELDAQYAACHQGVTPGGYVRLSVSDTGCGMDGAILDHIFEPFFTTKPKEHGTGLGLATVYGIVKQHGGNIWAYSEPGLGTTFKVYLPVAADPMAAAPVDTPSASMPQTTGWETVLLVEDNPAVRDLARDILKQAGYQVLAAEGGIEALSLLAKGAGPVHLLLTDVVMPRMNGKELFKRVRALYPAIQVLYMSGYTEDVIAHQGVMDPGVDFIQKPFSARDLVAKVREILDGDQNK